MGPPLFELKDPRSFKTPKEHIDHLNTTRTNNPMWLNEARKSGNLVQAALRGVLYFNELLQNIDDANGQNIWCDLKSRECVVRHSGKHFEPENVERICSLASEEFNDKTCDANATGFKGIGFKSLISIARTIYIFSKGYTFRFDQNWTQTDFPWHRVPIWTELKDIPLTLRPYFEKCKELVTFIFVLREDDTFKKQLKSFRENPRPSLFLRNVKTIHFDLDGEKGTLTLDYPVPLRRRLSDGNCIQEWFVDSIDFNPKDVRANLESLNGVECPVHLREDKLIKIRFAFLLTQEHLTAAGEAELFNNLPTKVRLKLPFAVDCHFLLKPDREHLIDNPWNYYLITCIGFYQFSFLQKLAPSQDLYILAGLGPESLSEVDPKIAAYSAGLGPKPLSDVEPKIAAAYSMGFNQGCSTYPFLPPLNPRGGLLTLNNCCIDTTGFYSALRDEIPEYIPLKLVCPDLLDLPKLKQYSMVKQWGYKDIIDQLETIFQKKCTAQLCYKVLHFFMVRNETSFESFKNMSLLTVNNTLAPLSSLSLPGRKEMANPPPFINVPILHPDILSFDTEKGDLRSWLERNGIEMLTPKRIIEKYVKPYVESPLFSIAHSKKLIDYLFQLYQKAEIESADLGMLQAMLVYGHDNQAHQVRTLYLNSHYNPGSSLEAILTGQSHLFVRPAYMTDPSQVVQWKEFFIALGAQDELDLHMLKEVTIKDLRTAQVWLLDGYIKYLSTGDNKIIKQKRDDYPFKNFVFFPLLQYLNNPHLPSFARHFWTELNKESKRFIERDRSCQFMGVQKGEKPQLRDKDKLSYIKYILNENALIRATNGCLYPASQLLTPSFKSSLTPDLVADIDIEMNDELAEYLGFKTRLSYQKCFEFLKKLRDCPEAQFDICLYKTILKQLIQNYNEADQKDKQTILPNPWSFLAENNTWQPVDTLNCYAVEGRVPSYDSKSWFKNVLPLEEMSLLAKMFSRFIKTEIIEPGAIRGAKPSSVLLSLLRERLPLIAKVDAHHYRRASEDILKKLAEQFKKLNIFEADRIPLQDDEIELAIPSAIIAHCFYHVGDWRSCQQDLLKFIAKHFALKDKSKSDFKEILTADSIEGWLAKKKMKQDDLPKLNLLRNQLLPLSLLPRMPPVNLPVSVVSPVTPAPTINTASVPLSPPQTGTPLFNRSLTDEMKNLSIQTTPPLKVAKTLEFGSSSLDVPSSSNPPEAKQKTPMKPVEELDLSKIPMSKATKKTSEKSTTPSGTDKNKESPALTRGHSYVPRQDENTEELKKLGDRGEKLIFLWMAEYFKQRHKIQEQPSSAGILTLRGFYRKSEKPLEIIIKWLNHARESYEPYDLDLIKNKNGEIRTRKVEVKTTKGNTIHFYLSGSEHDLMESNKDNYRVYCVLQGDSDHPSIKKISHLKEDLDQRIYNKRVIKYEIH